MANELDIVSVSPQWREQFGAQFIELFALWRPLLSDAAWGHCRNVLGPPDAGKRLPRSIP